MGELVLNKVKGRKNWRPLFHDSSIPWPSPGFHGLSSVFSSCEVLQRQHSIPAKSRQGGPSFHEGHEKLELQKTL